MERTKIVVMMSFAALLLLLPKTEADPPLRPLCVSQFSLVNYACSMLPHSPNDLPSPDQLSTDSDDDEKHGHRKHGREHGHRHRHHHESRQAEDCCRWLKELDDECVCDLLVRLPPFLSRPAHSYTLMVDETCTVSYECGGRVVW